MCSFPSSCVHSSAASSSERAGRAGAPAGSLAWVSGEALSGAAPGAGSGLVADPHRTLPPAEGGPPLYLQEEAAPGGRGGWGRRAGQGRADWRELAVTRCCPSGTEARPAWQWRARCGFGAQGWRTRPLPSPWLCARRTCE